jgi:hypothetical protein
MKNAPGLARRGRKDKTESQKNAESFCLDLSKPASEKTRRFPEWAASAVARRARQPITLPKLTFLEIVVGGDDVA